MSRSELRPGVLIVRRLTRAAEALTPAGMARGVSGAGNRLTDSLTALFDDIRAGMAEREAELRTALGIDDAQSVTDPLWRDVATAR